MYTIQDYTDVFSALVAESLSLTTEHFRSKAAGDAGIESLVANLRAAYGNRIKPLNYRDPGYHDSLEKGLGQYFGALVAQLSAIAAKWQQIQIQGDARNPLVDVAEERDRCCEEALQSALRVSRAACAYTAEFERVRSETLATAQILAAQLTRYARLGQIFYCSNPRSIHGCSYEVRGISASVCTNGKIVCSFYYFDGVDEIGAPLNLLFTQADQIAEVQRVAAVCFGDKAKLAKDLSTVELVAPVPLVKLSD